MRPPVEAIAQLSIFVGAIALLIFIGVEAALIYAAWRYRESRMAGPAPQIHGNRTLEIAWTAIPLLILAVVFVLMLGTMREIGGSVAAGSSPGPLRVTAKGYQWWWEYRYPGNVLAVNEMHIPVGTPIDVDLESGDVIHSFWVPGLSGKTDMIPGRINHLRLYASKPGVYEGACAEFCGVEHAWMRIRVVAEDPGTFQTWLDGQAKNASGAASRGQQVFAANVCVSCHTIRGANAGGQAGPDLTHLASRATLAAGVLPNDARSLRAWIADPQRYKPGALMPLVPLSDADLDALVEYLGSLR